MGDVKVGLDCPYSEYIIAGICVCTLHHRICLMSKCEKNNLNRGEAMSERFHIETGQHTKGEMQLIYDNEGLDDYYFINDEKDFKDLCNLLNELHNDNEANKKTIKQLNDRLRFHKKLEEEYKKETEELTKELEKYESFLQKSEMANADLQNSKYQCHFCGAVGVLHETFKQYK